jgi:hypothetical protein
MSPGEYSSTVSPMVADSTTMTVLSRSATKAIPVETALPL